MALGRAAAKEYRRRNDGRSPNRCGEVVRGRHEAVFGYTEDDCREWLDDFLREM